MECLTKDIKLVSSLNCTSSLMYLLSVYMYLIRAQRLFPPWNKAFHTVSYARVGTGPWLHS